MFSPTKSESTTSPDQSFKSKMSILKSQVPRLLNKYHSTSTPATLPCPISYAQAMLKKTGRSLKTFGSVEKLDLLHAITDQIKDKIRLGQRMPMKPFHLHHISNILVLFSPTGFPQSVLTFIGSAVRNTKIYSFVSFCILWLIIHMYIIEYQSYSPAHASNYIILIPFDMNFIASIPLDMN